MMRFLLTGVLILTVFSFVLSQDKPKLDASCGADLATMYLWRGYELGKGPAIQPWGQLSYSNFSLGAWTNSNFTGSFQEIDIYVKYQYKRLTVSFTDLFFPGYEGLNQDYFNFRNSTTGHAAELGLSYELKSNFPLTISGGIILYGKTLDANPNDLSKNNFSSYFEAKYRAKTEYFRYSVFAGITPTSSILYCTEGFAFINTGVSLEKDLSFSESFKLPAKLTLAANPAMNKFFVVFLISI